VEIREKYICETFVQRGNLGTWGCSWILVKGYEKEFRKGQVVFPEIEMHSFSANLLKNPLFVPPRKTFSFPNYFNLLISCDNYS
jgi:hypothetical protein